MNAQLQIGQYASSGTVPVNVIYAPVGAYTILGNSSASDQIPTFFEPNAALLEQWYGGPIGGGTPGGSNGNIQYNNSGSFGGSSNLNWNGTQLQITGTISASGSTNQFGTNYIINGSPQGSVIAAVYSAADSGFYLCNSSFSPTLPTVSAYGAFRIHNASTGEVQLYTSSSYWPTFYASGSEAMRLTTSRNLLIGTTTDGGQKLQVTGTGYISGQLQVGSAVTNSNSLNVLGQGSFEVAGAGASNPVLVLGMNNTAVVESTYYNATSGDVARVNKFGGFDFCVNNSSTPSVEIAPTTGHLLVGTTSDNGARLQVNGKTSLSASTTSAASLNIGSGTAPTSPGNGDIWFDGTNIYMQIGGVTKTFQLV